MRTAFIESLLQAARNDKRIFLLTGDLGFAVLEPFIREFPERFINAGITEQNMVGFAAGLALTGKIPVVYSIATFITLRCYEQIRNDVCYQKLNVKIVGAGGGLTYSQYGATHHSMEDISLMRLLPSMMVICPGDPLEVKGAVAAMFKHEEPCYLRIGARGEPVLHKNDFSFVLGKGVVMRDGSEAALMATGNMLENAIRASEMLQKRGISCRVISMHTVKPLDEELIKQTVKEIPYIFTVEEHSKIGGLGSAVAEVIAENKIDSCFFARIAGPDAFQTTAGWLQYIRKNNGLTPELIAGTVLKNINFKGNK